MIAGYNDKEKIAIVGESQYIDKDQDTKTETYALKM